MEVPFEQPAGAAAAHPNMLLGSRRHGAGVTTRVLACLLFVLSGACGLAYEVVWTKYLGLFLGNTVLLHTSVLGTFMGGMALGSFVIGRRAHRVHSPLKAYGWLELVIAGYAFCFPMLSGAGEKWVVAAAAAFGPGSWMVLGVKLLACAALLAVPTVLMGATLPLLTAHVERALRDSGETRNMDKAGDGANWLYFANCAGAVIGTLVTGFYLIPQLGLASTDMAAAIANAAIGLTAAGIGSAVVAGGGEKVSGPAAAAAANPAERRVLLAICLSGATAFLYELVWTRLFAVALGSSTYSFTLMLAAFISGLALGSITANVIPARRKPLLCFAAAEVGIGLVIALSLMLYPRLPFWCWQWRWLLRATPESIGLYHLCQYGLIFAVMAAPTFLFGLTFPMAIRAAAEAAPDGAEDMASRAAQVYGWNTVGTLAGVALAGAVLIPLLGLQRTLQVGAALNFVIAWLLLSGGKSRVSRPFLAAIAVGVFALAVAPHWHPGTFTYGQFRANVPPPPSYAAYEKALLARKPLYYREDFGTTVAVLETDSDQPGEKQRVLVVDGKADATSVDDMPTQKLLGHLPMFIKPDAKKVFVLGLGSGATAGSILTHPGVERVDCVELSPAVAEAANYFAPATHDVVHNPRMHLTVDDGKTILAGSRPGTYDLIISQPTNPWIAGSGSLFSEESYRSAARALKEDGVMAQWFHTYALDDRLAATIIRTCRQVFPHAILLQGHQNDFMVVGSRQPLRVSFPRMEREFASPAVREDLASIHITSVAALLSRQSHTAAALEALGNTGGINTDDLPLLEYLAPDALYVGASAQAVRSTDCRLQPGSGLAIEAYFAEKPATRFDYQSLITSQMDPRTGNPVLLLRLLREYLDRWPDDGTAARQASGLLWSQGARAEAIQYLERAAQHGDSAAVGEAARLRAALDSERHSMFRMSP